VPTTPSWPVEPSFFTGRALSSTMVPSIKARTMIESPDHDLFSSSNR